MKANPFTSETFVSKWLEHFNNAEPGRSFPSIQGLGFTKHRFLPLFTNIGKTHTKGINYTVGNPDVKDLKGKVLLIYDVPTYFEMNPKFKSDALKLVKVKQYPGFLINLVPFGDLDEYMASSFKRSSRYKLKKYRKKLESCFDIRYKMFYGEMSKEEYDLIFKAFNHLLNKRFEDKQVTNNNLAKQEWDFYYELVYPLLLKKKAGLFVIYNGNQPIGVTLNYFSEDILFDAITVFDIDYAKFRLGSVTIMKLIEWSIEQNIKIFDFSKGYFDYKKRWASKEYDFEYQIIYDSTSIYASSIALFFKKYFELKQILRDKKVNEKLHSLTYRLKKKSKTPIDKAVCEYLEPEDFPNENLVQIDLDTIQSYSLKTAINDFLYINNESQLNLKIFKVTHEAGQYLLHGKEKKTRVKMTFK